jgi:hypothetical protein
VRYCGYPDTASGEPCRQLVGIDIATGRCLWHDPERLEQAAAVRAKGRRSERLEPPAPGQALEPPPEPRTLEDVITWQAWVTVALATRQIDKPTASGLTYSLQNLRGALASRDLEREIQALRGEIAALKQRRGELH